MLIIGRICGSYLRREITPSLRGRYRCLSSWRYAPPIVDKYKENKDFELKHLLINNLGALKHMPLSKGKLACSVTYFYEYHKRLSILHSFILIVIVSILYEVWSGNATLNSLISGFKQYFVVSAAKPLVADPDPKAKNELDSKIPPGVGGGRRNYYNFIADVVEAVQNTVVCIEVKDHRTVNWYGVPQVSSNGSGFIVEEDGLILTNAHVVANKERTSLSVKLQDGRCFAGYVEDVDYESDLATVRIKARGLPTLRLGCSSEIRVGEWVAALGSPLNLSNTVTAGIISSNSRGANELGIHANDINYIQTDAAITFGNSGGPLVNLDGEAIGINSMKVTAGISFAIPVDHAKKFLAKSEARRASGKANTGRPYLGLSVLTMTDEIRREIQTRTGISTADRGVLIWQVVVGSPAYLAGIHPGDIITSINDQQVNSAAQVHEVISKHDKLLITLQRREKILAVTVVPENILQ